MKSYRLDDSPPPEWFEHKADRREPELAPIYYSNGVSRSLELAPIYYSNGVSRSFDCDSQFNEWKCHLEKTHLGLHEDSHGNCWATADVDWYNRMTHLDV